MSTTALRSTERLGYADLLRTIATLGVVVIHVCALPITVATAGSSAWHFLNLYDGLARWCVPLFFMLSGMFLLDDKKPLALSTLLRRNLLRVLVALLCWGAFYAVVDYRLAGGSFRSASGLLGALGSVLSADTHFHLWFLYAILGLYLITPMLRAFVRGATPRDFHWFFLVVLLLCSLIPTLLHFFPNGAVSNWLFYLQLDIPVQRAILYLTCYVAGYYLRRATLSPVVRRVIYLSGLLGAAITVGGTALLVTRGVNDYYLYTYTTPNVLAMAVACFVLLRHLPTPNPHGLVGKFITVSARVSFGIYLVHEFFLLLLGRFGITALTFHAALSVPILTLGVFALSLAASWCISKLPVAGRYLS